MNRTCERCGVTFPERHIHGGLCVGCEYPEEPPVAPVRRELSEHHCAQCGHPSWGDLCLSCDDVARI